MLRLFFIIFVLMWSPLVASPYSSEKIESSYGRLPLAFEPNQGQADSSVKFLCRGRGYSLFLCSNEAVLVLKRTQNGPNGAERWSPTPDLKSPSAFLFQKGGQIGLDGLNSGDFMKGRDGAEPGSDGVFRLKLKGANPLPDPVGGGRLLGKSNYFIGNDPSKWRTNIPQYARVNFKDAYPGVDLVYYGNQGQLEYDFKVAAGADPQAIQWDMEGADETRVDAEGNLVLSVAGGPVIFKAPLCYQRSGAKRQVVPSRYVVNENHTLGFMVADYDRNRELVVDPALVYSTFLGGSNQDPTQGIAVDVSGSAYVTGHTNSANFPLANPYQASHAVGFDAYVTKFSPAGNVLIYSTYLGGSAHDYGESIKVDINGNAFITGATSSADFPTVNPFQATFSATGSNAFVTKLNSNGNALIYSTFLGGSANDGALGIAIDLTGNAYVTGVVSSPNFPVANAYQATLSPGVVNAFLSKFNLAGNALVYSTYLGGNNQEKGLGVAVNLSGEAYVVGTAWSSNFPVVNAFQPTLLGTQNAFVTKFSSAGNSLIYSTYLGGSNGEYGSSIALDLSGCAYVVGITASVDFPTVNAYYGTLHGSGSTWDVFLTKFNPSGNGLLYSTYFGGTATDIVRGVAVDLSDCAYVTGYTSSTDFPIFNAFQSSYGGNPDDAFVTKFNAAGNGLQYSTYFGGNNYDEGYGLALDNAGNAFVAGMTQSPDFPTVNPFQAVYTGGAFGQNGFVAKISDVNPSSTPTVTETSVVSPTPSATPTASWTETTSFTATTTASPTPTGTESPSCTQTSTPSPPDSYTFTPTSTSSGSATVSQTVTPSASGSPSPSVTETATITITQVAGPTLTETPSFTPSVTVSAAVAFNQDPPTVVSAVMVPNPITQNQGALEVQLLGNATQIVTEVYSPGYTLIDRNSLSGSFGPGYVSLNLDASRWPLGLVYLRITARGNGKISTILLKGFIMR